MAPYSVSSACDTDRGGTISDTSSEDSSEPSLEGNWIEAFAAAGGRAEELGLDVARIARERLVDVEVMLRDFWYDSIDHTPLVAARISVAARLVHKAAEALGPQTLL